MSFEDVKSKLNSEWPLFSLPGPDERFHPAYNSHWKWAQKKCSLTDEEVKVLKEEVARRHSLNIQSDPTIDFNFSDTDLGQAVNRFLKWFQSFQFKNNYGDGSKLE